LIVKERTDFKHLEFQTHGKIITRNLIPWVLVLSYPIFPFVLPILRLGTGRPPHGIANRRFALKFEQNITRRQYSGLMHEAVWPNYIWFATSSELKLAVAFPIRRDSLNVVPQSLTCKFLWFELDSKTT